MGPRDAGLALEMIGTALVVPVHYATFPALAGTPDELRDYTTARVVELEPGETYEHQA
jgi:L-ascorbate metabolism protein UlaG (beta-lactamase superfamily)